MSIGMCFQIKIECRLKKKRICKKRKNFIKEGLEMKEEQMIIEMYDVMFFKKPEMLKNKHFRLFLFLVCF